MKKKLSYLILAGFILILNAQAQDELYKIIPPSPTVASLGGYGDVPVGYYTGTPNISIPIYEISAGTLKLPISLSYNASGVKVEELASWVGLGWSLSGAGGVITRVVRGLPDEYGYMSPAAVQISDILALPGPIETWLNPFNPNYSWPIEFKNTMSAIAKLEMDAEADMFYFNVGEHSGKFYYSQEEENFISIPRKSIFFDKAYFLTHGKWHLVMEDGVEYYFDLFETNLTYTECNGNPSTPESVKTGWFLTQIKNSVSTIGFAYDPLTYSRKNISSHTYNSSDGLYGGGTCLPQHKICNTVNNYSGYKLSSITFDGGRLNFNANTNRCDLLGDKRLDNIEIVNYAGSTPVKKIEFNYDYFNKNYLPAQGCGNEENSYNVRLKLVSLITKDSLNNQLNPYSFEYNQSYPLPSIHSYSQDAWGYYNGKNNGNLVPPYIHPNNLYSDGANRTVDTVRTSAGMLTKLYYPTKGYTQFEYENHKVNGYVRHSNSPYLKNKMAIIDTSTPCLGSSGAPIFCADVTINDKRGTGAFVDFRVDNMYCWNCASNPPPAPTSCAVLSLISSDNNRQIVCNEDNVFIPNGNYVLKADFTGSSNPSDYENFSVRIFWEEYNPPPGPVKDVSIGGLRIKKITDVDNGEIKRTRLFDYTTNGKSSGFLSNRKFYFEYEMACIPGGSFLVRSSYSNIPFGLTQGSPVGYSKVTVTQDSGGNGGKSVYSFSNAGTIGDVGYEQFPFPDPISFDHRRGLLLKQEDFKRDGSNYQVIHTIENEYKPLNTSFDWEQIGGYTNTDPFSNEVIGIKAAFLDIWANGTIPFAFPIAYKTISEWVRQVNSKERFYDESGNYLEAITTTEFTDIHMQPVKINVVESNGSTRNTYYQYPQDYPSNASYGISGLIENHNVNTVVEKVTSIVDSLDNEYVVGGVFTTFNGKQLPAKVLTVEHAEPIPILDFNFSYAPLSGVVSFDTAYKNKIEFTRYNMTNGKLLEQRKSDDIYTSYIWGYDTDLSSGYRPTLPVTEAVNAREESIFHTSFEEDGMEGLSVTGEKYYSGSYYTIPTEDQPTGSDLRMTYWYYDGSWKFRNEINYSPTISETNATRYDEIRVYPSGAQMTTYTYAPGFGVTSITDANNKITFYDYDTFGRLIRIRDDENNVLKTFVYHYKSN